MCAALLPSCGDRALPSDGDLFAAYPGGRIFESIESKEMQVADPAPEFLRGDGRIEGHGISVPLPDVNPDGSHPVHRWGPWAYYYLENSEKVAKESEGEFRDSHREGRWTFWHRNGRKRAEGTFTHSRMTGHWNCWRDDESMDTEHTGNYRDGQRIEK